MIASLKTTKKDIKTFLESQGLKMPSSMLSVGSDSKTAKGEQYDYITGILYLIPSYTLCPASKLAKCDIACLVTAGLASVYKSVNISRANKTAIFERFPNIAYELIRRDIRALERKAKRENKNFCVRLNGTSDIDHNSFIASMPDVQFYDYTKMSTRKALPNYHLTFSYSGANPKYLKHVDTAIENGLNVAVVFNNKNLPDNFLGLPVLNGDDSDLRFLDYKIENRQAVVGLFAKGQDKKDKTGFVVDTNLINIKEV